MVGATRPVTGLDISTPMFASARERLVSVQQALWRLISIAAAQEGDT
jgi:hypothetical protein